MTDPKSSAAPLSDDEMRAWGSYWKLLARMPPLGLADAAHRLFIEVTQHRLVSMSRESLVKHMVQRFLGWRLPEDFRPDDGISFTPINNAGTAYQTKHTPSGTNLFDATQAEAMVRYMLDGLTPPAQPASPLAVMAQALRDKAAAESAAAPRQPEGPLGSKKSVLHAHAVLIVKALNNDRLEPQDLAEQARIARDEQGVIGKLAGILDDLGATFPGQPAVSRAEADPSADAPLDALKDLLDQVAPNDGTACALCGDKGDSNCCLHVAAARAALAAAPRDERGPGMAQCWCGAGMAPEHEGPHLAAAAAPLGAPVARLDEVREAVLAERKKWVDALNGTCDRCLRSAANTLTDDDSEAGEFLDCARCGTALRDLVTGVEPIPKSAPEKQSPAPAAKMDGR